MLTGKEFAEELLRILNVPHSECQVETEESSKASETEYRIKDTSKIILREDSSQTNKIITATHEIGHYINNRNNITRFVIFKLTGIMFIMSVLLGIIVVLVNRFYLNIPLIVLLGVFIFCFLSSFWANYIKVKDEYRANVKALRLLYRHSNQIFRAAQNDSRSWNSIRKESKEQLIKGTQAYRKSSYVLIILSLLPIFVFILLEFFGEIS
ncbi:M48 family metalloprotease [Bacillus thuringiensis]|uniref:M48 family metalloprotease n=1 Tax=Bacillus thuringiensis TaxID=1428 RepID=UPI0005CEBE12|nr:M48 family metalloprotease [Bacillus thuringiensis]